MYFSTGIIGNIYFCKEFENLQLDYLLLDWYDAEKGVIRASTTQGAELGFRNLQGIPLQHGDVLFADDLGCIVVAIKPCPCLIIKPQNALEMASVCFEIGNRHLPMAISADAELMVAYEAPLHLLLQRGDYHVRIAERILQQAQTLKIHAWRRKTNFNISLAPEIDESTIDTTAD